jgi:hypothetical protein
MITLLYTDKSGKLQTLDFDATLRELHTGTAQATEHPVESGADITDHVRPDRARLSADLFVTNTPIGKVAASLGGANIPLQLEGTTRVMTSSAKVSGGGSFPIRVPGMRTAAAPISVTPAVREDKSYVVSGNVLQFPVRFDRVTDVWATLDGLRRSSSLVQVLSSLRTYDNMAISSLSTPVTVDDAVTIAVEFTEIFVAESQTIDAPLPKEKRATKVKPQGPKATYELEPQQESRAHVGFDKVMALYSRDGQN